LRAKSSFASRQTGTSSGIRKIHWWVCARRCSMPNQGVRRPAKSSGHLGHLAYGELERRTRQHAAKSLGVLTVLDWYNFVIPGGRPSELAWWLPMWAPRSTWFKVSQVACLNKPLRQRYFGLPTCHLAHWLTPCQARKKREEVAKLG
jgi:hypothetical protein